MDHCAYGPKVQKRLIGNQSLFEEKSDQGDDAARAAQMPSLVFPSCRIHPKCRANDNGPVDMSDGRS